VDEAVSTPLIVPEDVREWLRAVFRSGNERCSEKLMRCPTEYETSLDHTLIEHLTHFSSPFRFPGDWVVRIDTHFLGGGRHFEQWEIADIGVLVVFRHAGKVIRSKVALLQSKRLYPTEMAFDEGGPMDYVIGFGRLFEADDEWAAVSASRRFGFTERSGYKALIVGDEQYKAIARYERQYSIPVYYFLYNPWRFPWTVEFPLMGEPVIDGSCEVGCRVVPAEALRLAVRNREGSSAPSFGELAAALPDPFRVAEHRAGWRLEHFVVDLLVGCQTGYVAASRQDAGLDRVFTQRGAPIASAIAITIDAPGPIASRD
jgi:hypothetical protein